MAHAFVLILLVTLVLTLTVYLFIDPVLRFLQIPQELYAAMRTYLLIIFAGLAATFLYNFFACLLRAAGNSVAPLWFLGAAALLNIGLDLLFVLGFGWGVAGAGRAGRPAGHLGRHSHRLGSGRRRGIWVLLPLPRPASGGNVLTIFPCRRIRSVVKF